MKITFLTFLLFSNFLFSQQHERNSDNKHSFQIGYAETPGKFLGLGKSKLSNFSYFYERNNFHIKFSYFHSSSINANDEYDETENRLYVPQIGYDDEYFGFSFGIIFFNNIQGEAPDMFALPAFSLKIGYLSDYYFSASFLDEQSIPSLSINLNYVFKHQLSYLKIGSVYFGNWKYNSEIQYSFFNFALVRLRSIFNPKFDRGFFYGSVGFFIII